MNKKIFFLLFITETLNRKTYEDQIQFLYDYLKVRINWLNIKINNKEFIYS